MFESIFGKDTFVGVDFGTSSIKVVELKVVEDKPVLSNYAWVSLGETVLGKGDINSEYFYAIAPNLLKKIYKEAKIKSNNVYVSLPSSSGLIMTIDFPKIESGDMEQAVRFEAQKHIPMALDDVVVNWNIIGSRKAARSIIDNDSNHNLSEKEINIGEGNEILKVLLIVASKNKVLRYENLIKTAGLNLKSINLETFPIVRSLVGNDPGNFIIVDIGARICNIVLVEKGVIKINRSIDAGGLEITRTIAKSMNIDDDRAAEIKVSEKNLLEVNSEISFFPLEKTTEEVGRMIRAYFNNNEEDDKKIDAIILSGGTANMTGIADYFFEKLQIKTIIGDPLSRIEYDNMLEPMISGIRSSFSVCIGLAIEGVDEYIKLKK